MPDKNQSSKDKQQKNRKNGYLWNFIKTQKNYLKEVISYD